MSADTAPEAAPATTPVNDEIAVMRRLVNALDSLDPTTQTRVLRWLVNRYQAISLERDGEAT